MSSIAGGGKRKKTGWRILLLAALCSFSLTPEGRAITVVTHFIGGTPPPNLAGGGNLADVFNAAVRRWEAAYPEPFTITLYFGWETLGDAGNHILLEQGGVPSRELVGTILFDNSGAVSFYMDPTPDADEEYSCLVRDSVDLGGGAVNAARLLTQPTGDAVDRYDLLSAAMHEIGHALGLSNRNIAFTDEILDGTIRVAAELPYQGTVVPLSSNYSGITSHLDPERLPYGSVMSGLNENERRLPSAVDILVNAQISRFAQVRLEPGNTEFPRSSIDIGNRRTPPSARPGR